MHTERIALTSGQHYVEQRGTPYPITLPNYSLHQWRMRAPENMFSAALWQYKHTSA